MGHSSTGWRWRLMPAAAAAIVMLAGVTLAGPVAAADTPACPVTRPMVELGAPLPHTAARIKAGGPLVVVAIGSSSTAGAGASGPGQTYPAWVERELRRLLPNVTVTVHNRGIGGQVTSDMVARFGRDLTALKPDLVLWQTGTNEPLRDVPAARFAADLKAGLVLLKQSHFDVVLVDQQYSPALGKRYPTYHDYVEALRQVATSEREPVFGRYTAMRSWTAAGLARPADFLSGDQLHMNDAGYHCLGKAVAMAVVCASGGSCPVEEAGHVTAGR